VKRLGLESTGLWSVVFEAFWLGAAYCSVLFGSDFSTASLALLIAGVCLSRIGLWVFDIAVTQLQQEQIPDGVRIRVGAVQSSMNAFFTLASFATGFLFPDPAKFHVFVASAFFSVSLAALTFWCGMRIS
jgi:iron-regulated transporter 1